MSLPTFPIFKSITIADKTTIKKLTSQFEPYSDFDFTSLFCWNPNDANKVSLLNGNLIIQLADYMQGELIFSVLGKSKIDETLEELLLTRHELKLVPDIVIEHIKNKQKFKITEDRDQFDYIYKLEDHVTLPGKLHKSKRSHISRFIKANGHKVAINKVDFSRSIDKKNIEYLFDEWAKHKDKHDDDVAMERQAILRLLKYARHLPLIGLIVYVDSKPEGFSITEKVHGNYAMYHFHKTLLGHRYIDTYFTNETSKILLELGCKYINWEQDLGLEGLRASKTNYLPFKDRKS